MFNIWVSYSTGKGTDFEIYNKPEVFLVMEDLKSE